MCGIVGSNFHDFSIVENALTSISHRGKDCFQVVNLNNFIIGANRLSIQDLSPNSNQPLFNEDKSICIAYNGELWTNKYNLNSDIQAVLKYYEEYNENMFKMLDGMFAIAIWNKNKLILARDYIGEIPIYYHYNNGKLCFGSELKAFKEFNCSEIKLIQPGHYLVLENNILWEHKYYTLPEQEITDDKETIIHNFRSILETATKKRIPKEVDYAVLLSGGIDSTIITYLLAKENPNLQAFTVHLGDDKSSKRINDLYYAREVSKWLNIKLNEVIISEQDVLDTIEETIKVIEDKSWTQVASGLSHILMAKQIEGKFKVVFGGGGSDELFASYPSQKRWSWKDDQYDGARKNLIKNIHKNNIIRENKSLLWKTIELRSPFLDKDFVEYAINIPIKYRLEKGRMKPILRYAFPEIPEHILWREKICEGEGVGVDPILKDKKDDIKAIYNKFYNKMLVQNRF